MPRTVPRPESMVTRLITALPIPAPLICSCAWQHVDPAGVSQGLQYRGESALRYFRSDLGDTVVVGAYGEDSVARGVNGNQDDNGAVDSGAAYVSVRRAATGRSRPISRPPTEAQRTSSVMVGISGDTAVSELTARTASPWESTATKRTTEQLSLAPPTSRTHGKELDAAGVSQGLEHRDERFLRWLRSDLRRYVVGGAFRGQPGHGSQWQSEQQRCTDSGSACVFKRVRWHLGPAGIS